LVWANWANDLLRLSTAFLASTTPEVFASIRTSTTFAS
jgi:hypothetical protein